MMLASESLKVVPLTIHMPLRAVAAAITSEAIIETGEIILAALKSDFAIADPRLTVAGLNPHAGEDGVLGGEDEALIEPAVMELRRRGHQVRGPLAADSLFHEKARSRYDAALCMYHDQALIPSKTLAFWDGVNVTLGLPIVRTSPDHGTAFDLAGTGRADHRSMVAAIRMAAQIADARAPMPDDSLPPLREVIAAHGLNAKKSLGQNFPCSISISPAASPAPPAPARGACSMKWGRGRAG